jgi:genome maintenance exonuclease 1
MTFIHNPIGVPKLKRIHVDGIRLYENLESKTKKYYTSITSITSHYSKDKFKAWRKRVGEDEANRITKLATGRGTATHSLVEKYLCNEEIPKAAPLPTFLFQTVKKFLDDIDNIIAIETPMFSEALEIAGTPDIIAEYLKKLSIIDIKTSEKPKPREWIEGYFVQTMAYAVMLYELTGKKVDQLVIIMACENGEVEVYIETDLKKYLLLLKQYIDKFNNDKRLEYGFN